MQCRAVFLSSFASSRLCAFAFKKVVTVMHENEISEVLAESNLLDAIPCSFLSSVAPLRKIRIGW
jgi:hypothetical protein